MMTHSISHAVLISADEADELLTGRGRSIRRSCGTQLRMRVGLLQADGLLVGSANLIDSLQFHDTEQQSEWVLIDFENLIRPMRIAPGEGPLWRRLTSEERGLLSDRDRMFPENESQNQGDTYLAEEASPALAPENDDESGDELWGAVSANLGASPEAAPLTLTDLAGDTPEEDGSEPMSNAGTTGMIFPSVEAHELPAKIWQIDHEIEEVRERAFAFVPDRSIDVQEANRLLIALRDGEIKPTYPSVRPEKGILRRAMMQALLGKGVASQEDYVELISDDLRRSTDSRHVDAYLDPIIAILSRIQ